MAEQFYTILTKVGKAKIANVSALQSKLNLVKFQVGDSGGAYYNPTEDNEQLKNKVWEGPISSITVDEDNPNWIVLQVMIPGDIGGFMIREAGVFDDEGNLIAIGKYPETYKPVVADGSTKDLVIKMILEVSNASSVTLKIDPTTILATKKDIEILENKIKNIKVPVTSVNKKIGDIELKAEDIKCNDGKTVETSLDDIAKNIGDKTTLKTTDKTNLVNAVNELFTNANNGKQNWVDVVGSPLVSTDTFSTLKDKTQTLKNTLASSLTVKEQNSSGTESLQNLINKVGNIKVGKRFIEGTQLVKLSYTQVYNLNTDFTMNTILLHFNDRTSNTKLNFIFSPIFSGAEWGNVNTSPEIYITATYPKNSTNMTNDIRMSLTITNNQISIYCTATMDCDLKYSIFE